MTEEFVNISIRLLKRDYDEIKEYVRMKNESKPTVPAMTVSSLCRQAILDSIKVSE